MTDRTPDPGTPAGDENLARLLAACHLPEPVDADLVRRVAERLEAEAAVLRTARRGRDVPDAGDATRVGDPPAGDPAGPSSTSAPQFPSPRADPRTARGDAPPRISAFGVWATVAAGALVTVVGAALFIDRHRERDVAASAGTTEPTAPAAPQGTEPAAPGPASGDLAAARERFLRLTPEEQAAYVAREHREARDGGDVPRLRGLFDLLDDARVRGVFPSDDAREELAQDAARIEPAVDWANAALGRRNVRELLDTLRRECPHSFAVGGGPVDEALRMIESARTSPWVEDADFAWADAVAKSVRLWEGTLAANSRFVAAVGAGPLGPAGHGHDPALADLRFEIRIADPWIVWQQYELHQPEDGHKNADRIAKARVIADRDAILLRETDRHFRELFAERFRLPALADSGRVLTAVVAWDREGWVRIVRAASSDVVPPGVLPATQALPTYESVRAVYDGGSRPILVYLGDEALRAQDEFPVAEGRIQKSADQNLVHMATLQLLDEYGAVLRGETGAGGGVGPPCRGPLWFREGLAAFLDAVEVPADRKETLAGAQFAHDRIPGERVMDVVGDGHTRTSRDAAKKWTIPELLAPMHDGDRLTRSGRLFPQSPWHMSRLFSARAWGLVHFLWFYDGGRYRPQFLDYMEAEFAGRASPETLAAALGRPDPSDWTGIDAEFEWYWDRCMARRFGWRDAGHTKHWDTDTAPPAGRYDPSEPDDDR